MELFYTQNICGNICTLDEQESLHCTRVLRHKVGDIINVIDGYGSLLSCKILSGNKNSTELEILEKQENFGAHNYHLTMAVCPTKNIDRYEWFLEKATEMGLDRVVPVIGEHSERKIVKSDRCNKILLSAAKQSLKGAVPVFEECCSVKEFIESFSAESSADAAADAAADASAVPNTTAGDSDIATGDSDFAYGDSETASDVSNISSGDTNDASDISNIFSGASKTLKLIAYCGEATKLSVKEAVKDFLKSLDNGETGVYVAGTVEDGITANYVKRIRNSVDGCLRTVGAVLSDKSMFSAESQQSAGFQQDKDSLRTTEAPRIAILIGPEGDFSPQEVELAMQNGFIPVHLGKSRLRTETAAVVACCEVYSELG